MPIDVIMPKVDMVMDEGTIVQWYKAEGDEVTAGEPLFDIETDKATMVIEAPASGTLGTITAPDGTTVPVATVIATILEPGEQGSKGAREQEIEDRRLKIEDRVSPPSILHPPSSIQRLASPLHPVSSDPRPRATPIARKLAQEHALDLSMIAGSGPQGRIGKIDVLQALQATASSAPGTSNGNEQAIEARTIPQAEPAHTIPQAPNRSDEIANAADGKLAPLTGIRKIVAQRMAISATIPQFTLTVDVDMTAAMQLRERLPYRPSVTAILARVIAPLLQRHPTLNASFRDDGIWLHTRVHLGIALDSHGDLLVPVIRDAQNRSLRELHEALTDLRQRAEAKQLPPSDLQGSTFSISNLGMFGIDQFTALVNPPEAAILAVGRISERPLRLDGEIVFKPTMTLTLSADHRVTDGATAARFLHDVRAALEEPYLLL